MKNGNKEHRKHSPLPPEERAILITSYGVSVKAAVRVFQGAPGRPHYLSVQIARAGLPNIAGKLELPVSAGDVEEIADMFVEIAAKLRGWERGQGDGGTS